MTLQKVFFVFSSLVGKDRKIYMFGENQVRDSPILSECRVITLPTLRYHPCFEEVYLTHDRIICDRRLIFEIVFFFIVTENSAVRDTFCICVAGESTMRLFLPYLLVCYINVAICNEEKCIIHYKNPTKHVGLVQRDII
jgi:hypothetical protein